MRIVSLLPSTTEILFDLGAGDEVVGVTFECDHPAEARTPDDRVHQRDARGAVARRDRRVRRRGDARAATTSTTSTPAPSPVSTPTSSSPRTSAPSARSTSSVVDDALAHLGCTAEVLTIDPHTLDEVLDVHRHARQGHRHRGRGRARWSPRCASGSTRSYAGSPAAAAAHAGAGVDRPAVRARPLGPRDGRPRRRRPRAGRPRREVGPHHLGGGRRSATPEVVVCAPCGYDLAGVAPRWPRARSPPACCRRGWGCGRSTPTRRSRAPGPRLVDGVEALAGILHPDVMPASPIVRRVR